MAMGSPEKETFGVRLGQDLASRVREYAEENQMSESDAMRELLSKGFQTDQLQQRVEELETELSEAREIGEERVDRLEDRVQELESQSVFDRLF